MGKRRKMYVICDCKTYKGYININFIFQEKKKKNEQQEENFLLFWMMKTRKIGIKGKTQLSEISSATVELTLYL